MTTDEYVPSDQDVRWQYVVRRLRDGATRTHAEREYTRWLAAHDARVRRDTAREALDGLIADKARMIALLRAENGGEAEDVLTHYRDTLHPEETPCVSIRDQLTRAEAQSEVRRLDITYWQERAQEFEARIKAVQDVLDRWQVDGYDALQRRIRRALDGER